MREWLLKEEKAKVGRPKLANEELVKKSRKMIIMSLLVCLIMAFSFFSYLSGSTPLKLAYSLSLEKVLGKLENDNGFLADEYYKNNDYVMEFKASDAVKKLGGYYEYTTYYLKNDEWVKYDTKKIINKTSFKIIYKSLKNTNRTWKVKLSVLDGNKFENTYEPSSWEFDSSEDKKESYAYKVFTVKGYYSPITKEESKQYKDDSKIIIETKKNNPRKFYIRINNEYSYNVKLSYTDESDKIVVLSNDKNIIGTSTYTVPNIDKVTTVKFKIYFNNINDSKTIEDIKPSNWELLSDSDGNYYIKNSYALKPEKAY